MPGTSYSQGFIVNGHQLVGNEWIPLVPTSPSRDAVSASSIAATASPPRSVFEGRGGTPSQYGGSRRTTPARSVVFGGNGGRGHSRSSSGSTSTRVLARNLAYDVERDGNTIQLTIDFEAEHLGLTEEELTDAHGDIWQPRIVLHTTHPRNARDFQSWFNETSRSGGRTSTGAEMTMANAVYFQLNPSDDHAASVRDAIDEILEDFWNIYRHRD